MKDKNGKVITCEEGRNEDGSWCKEPAFGVSNCGVPMCTKHNGKIGWHEVYPPEEVAVDDLVGQPCKKCGVGKLRLFKGDFGRFIGCDAYSTNQCKYKVQIYD